MQKTNKDTKEELLKAEEVLEQELSTDSLSFFSAIAFAHKALKSKIELKGELKKP